MVARQTRFAQGELTSGSSVITSGESFNQSITISEKTTNIVTLFSENNLTFCNLEALTEANKRRKKKKKKKRWGGGGGGGGGEGAGKMISRGLDL